MISRSEGKLPTVKASAKQPKKGNRSEDLETGEPPRGVEASSAVHFGGELGRAREGVTDGWAHWGG